MAGGKKTEVGRAMDGGTKKAQGAEALWAKFGEWAFATRSFPMVCIRRSRFRGLQTPRRHSARHARLSISWRDRSGRYRPEFIE